MVKVHPSPLWSSSKIIMTDVLNFEETINNIFNETTLREYVYKNIGYIFGF